MAWPAFDDKNGQAAGGHQTVAARWSRGQDAALAPPLREPETLPPFTIDIPDLPQSLRSLLRRVPRGRVTTYGALATALGDSIAARWVAQHLLDHTHGPRCRCHRVVRAGGELGTYITRSATEKRTLLTAEGVHIADDTVDLAVYGVEPPALDRPLARLRAAQNRLLGRHSYRSPRTVPQVVGGLDISYAAPDRGVATYALVELPSGRVTWTTTIARRVHFPYISGYLAFRELPLLLALLDKVCRADRLAPVLLVDGSGVLHPRRSGLATHLGLLIDHPTIGVTKKLLCGKPAGTPNRAKKFVAVHEGDEQLGWVTRPSQSKRKPIYVSPGHRVSVDFAARVVQEMLLGHKLPEPIYWADRLSRQRAREMRSADARHQTTT